MNPSINELVMRVKNGLLKSKEKILIPYSSAGKNLLWRLKDDGFIRGFEIVAEAKKRKCLLVLLKYNYVQCPSITDFRVISKVERRFSFRKKQMKYDSNGLNKHYFSCAGGVKPSRSGECVFVLK
jgi:small subunit ribosomal protein S8